MAKVNAKQINDRLGVKIFDESKPNILSLIKYTRKEIKQLSIDDLIKDGKWTRRLASIVNEIEQGG